MGSNRSFFQSTIGLKIVMAVSGLVLVGFVLGHMLGNLQIFLGPDTINAYAHKLKTLPPPVLWGFRLFLLAAVALHVWAAVKLVLRNRHARPEDYTENQVVQASYASRTMRWSGVVLLAFIIFHLAHFTVREVPGLDYDKPEYQAPLVKHGEIVRYGDGEPEMVFDVYAMMITGFSREHWYVPVFYIVAMGLLCLHLSHGVSSMFQSAGLRNRVWRRRLRYVARAYALTVFLGFIVIPIAVLAGWRHPHDPEYQSLERPLDESRRAETSESATPRHES